MPSECQKSRLSLEMICVIKTPYSHFVYPVSTVKTTMSVFNTHFLRPTAREIIILLTSRSVLWLWLRANETMATKHWEWYHGEMCSAGYRDTAARSGTWEPCWHGKNERKLWILNVLWHYSFISHFIFLSAHYHPNISSMTIIFPQPPLNTFLPMLLEGLHFPVNDPLVVFVKFK
jgi:hypothetical protein